MQTTRIEGFLDHLLFDKKGDECHSCCVGFFLGICIFHVLNSVQKVTINCKDKRLEIDIKLKLITNVNNILFFIDMHKVYNTYFEYSRIHFIRDYESFPLVFFARAFVMNLL